MATTSIAQGTKVTLAASGGDAVLTLTSLAAGAGRQAGEVDLGATIPIKLGGRLTSKFASAPTALEALRVYVGWSDDGTNYDGELGGSDAAFSDEQELEQLELVRVCPADADTGAQTWGFEVTCRARYAVFVVYNDADQALSGTAGDHELVFWPLEPATA